MALAQITLNRDEVQKMVDLADKHGSKQWFMAKDEGAYVGITGGEGETFENFIKYFAGCDPKADEDYYDNARHKFGGDDFGEHFDLQTLRDFLADEKNEAVILKVNAASISVVFRSRKPKAAPKPEAPKAKVSPKTAAPKAKAKAKKAANTKAPSTKPSVVKQTIGSVATAALAAGKTNEEVLKAVKAAFPKAKTTIGCINWYRCKLNKA